MWCSGKNQEVGLQDKRVNNLANLRQPAYRHAGKDLWADASRCSQGELCWWIDVNFMYTGSQKTRHQTLINICSSYSPILIYFTVTLSRKFAITLSLSIPLLAWDVIKSLASLLSVCLSVCPSSYGHNFYFILIKVCTEVMGSKSKKAFIGGQSPMTASLI